MKKFHLLLITSLLSLIIISCSVFNNSSIQDNFKQDSLATIVKTEAIVNELLETSRQKYVDGLTNQALGNGEFTDIFDFVYIRPEKFKSANNPKIAVIIEEINNKFKEIPKELKGLDHLQYLDLRKNQIKPELRDLENINFGFKIIL